MNGLSTNNGGEKKTSHLSFFGNITLFLSLVSVAGYFVSYIYQKGYKAYYHLDEAFITDINLTQTIIAMVSMLITTVGFILILYLFWLVNLVVRRTHKQRGLIIKYIIVWLIILPLFLGIILFSIEFINQSLKILLLIVYLVGVLFSLFIMPLFYNGKTYREKFSKNLSPYEYLINKGFKNVFWYSPIGFISSVIILFFILCIGAYFVGLSNSSQKDEYFIVEFNNADYVLIGDYNEKIIIAPFDREENEILAAYQIIDSTTQLTSLLEFKVIELRQSPTVELKN